ncbi:polysaccharide deacetylase family protein [Mucilaginibacter sp.]|uniref:polysaccharide deacetylase family protein n=1 Tax=Mucilaginibacter sp. TaxID=1882438 RepID=UPI0032657147
MKYLSFTILCLCLSLSSFAQKQTELDYTIAPWFNNKKAAVSLTFDDGIPGQYAVAVPLLDKYGFKGTFFMSVSIVNNQHISWATINKAALEGHEIANHALTHPHFPKMPLDSIAWECAESNKQMDVLVPAQKMITHAYPFGEGGGNTPKDKAIRKTVAPFFIGARATQNKPYPYNAYDFAKTNDDYYNINSQMISDSASMANFGKYMDETIAVGGWFCPTYHGIEDGWIITPGKVFAQHLIELDKRKDSVWIAPFKNVIQYHKERNSAKLKLLSKSSRRWTLSLRDTLSNQQNWDQPLTINLNTNGAVIKGMSQKRKKLPFKQNGQVYVFNALPGKDNIEVQFATNAIR